MSFRAKDERGQTPQGRGRFPGFDVLDQSEVWDDVTVGVVLGRLALPGQLAFFTPPEVAIAAPLLDLMLEQDAEPRIPVLALIDARLAAGETDGWHYDELPEDGQAWRDSLAFLDQDAIAAGAPFAASTSATQASLIQAVQDLSNEGEKWHGWPAKHVWSLWTRYACTAFYSHPWAWNEIGFPGPAYPRGYLNPGVNAREHFETADAGREDRNEDQVEFAARVEHARAAHARMIGQDRR